MAVISLMSLFGEHIGHITREDLTGYLRQLQDFFLHCLDIHTEFPDVSCVHSSSYTTKLFY